MKKVSFLNKIHKEGKLEVVEPSEDIKKAYLQRSTESLSSAKVLLKAGNLKDSVALSYYAMYHSLLASLFRIGIKCENHAAAIILLKEVFGIDNTIISKAKSERVDKQYYVDFEVNKDEAEKSIKTAEDFIAEMNTLLAKLNENSTNEYNKKAKELFLD
jgi:uncharacterized protein (UPF0332 family)